MVDDRELESYYPMEYHIINTIINDLNFEKI